MLALYKLPSRVDSKEMASESINDCSGLRLSRNGLHYEYTKEPIYFMSRSFLGVRVFILRISAAVDFAWSCWSLRFLMLFHQTVPSHIQPPSTLFIEPVMNEAASLNKKTASCAASSAVPIRGIEVVIFGGP